MASVSQQNLTTTAYQLLLLQEQGQWKTKAEVCSHWQSRPIRFSYKQLAGGHEKAHAGAADSVLICTWRRLLLLGFSHKHSLVWPETWGLMKRKGYCAYKQQNSELQCQELEKTSRYLTFSSRQLAVFSTVLIYLVLNTPVLGAQPIAIKDCFAEEYCLSEKFFSNMLLSVSI